MKRILLGIITFLLSGCASTDQLSSIRTFSTAVHDFSASANDAFTKLNSSFVDRNIAEVANGDKPVADSTFVGVLDDSKGFQETTVALQALGTYADALGALAGANSGTDIDKAATGLYGALSAVDQDAGKVDPSAPKISSQDLGILATLVKAIGDGVARDKQAAAIRKAVEIADPAVQTICKGVGVELSSVRPVYVSNLGIVYTSEFQAYQREQKPLAYAERIIRLQDLRNATLARRNADAFLEKLTDSAQSLAAAHTKIKQSLADSTITLADVTRAIGQLKSYADELKAFNADLGKGTP
jgi:hypothetical protein